jgi:hypothetical protein
MNNMASGQSWAGILPDLRYGWRGMIVQFRAICLSGDFDHYWQFHIEQDQRRLYPAAWSVVPK